MCEADIDRLIGEFQLVDSEELRKALEEAYQLGWDRGRDYGEDSMAHWMRSND